MQEKKLHPIANTSANNSLIYIIKRSIHQSHSAFKKAWIKCFLYLLLAGIVNRLTRKTIYFIAAKSTSVGIPSKVLTSTSFLLLAMGVILCFILAQFTASILPICLRNANTLSNGTTTSKQRPTNLWARTIEIFTLYLIISIIETFIFTIPHGQEIILAFFIILCMPLLFFSIAGIFLRNQDVFSSIQNVWQSSVRSRQFWLSISAFWGAIVPIILMGAIILTAAFFLCTFVLDFTSMSLTTLSTLGILKSILLFLAALLGFYIISRVLLASTIATIMVYQRLQARIKMSQMPVNTDDNNSFTSILKQSFLNSHNAFKDTWALYLMYAFLATLIMALVEAIPRLILSENENAGIPLHAHSNLNSFTLSLVVILYFIVARLTALILPVCQRHLKNDASSRNPTDTTEKPSQSWVVTTRILGIYLIIYVAQLAFPMLASSTTHSLTLSTIIGTIVSLLIAPLPFFAIIEIALEDKSLCSAIRSACFNYFTYRQFWRPLLTFWGASFTLLLAALACLAVVATPYSILNFLDELNIFYIPHTISTILLLISAILAAYIIIRIILASHMAAILIYQRLQARIKASK